jgi:drug/metabolite transporter (DMT)-like permease
MRFTLFGLVAILLWSTTIAFSRPLTEQLGTFTSAFWIYLLAGVMGLILAALQSGGSLRKMIALPGKYLWGCGALFAVYILALYLAVGFAENRSQVLAVGLLNYLWPGFSLVFSVPVLGRKARLWLIPGILIALWGVWLASTGASANEPAAAISTLGEMVQAGSLLPYLAALVAAVSWGLYSNLSRRWGGDQEGGAVPLFLLASGLLLGLIRLAVPEQPQWSPAVVTGVGYMALLPGMLAYVLWDQAVRKGNLILVATLSYLTPLLSTLISSLVLGVWPGPMLWLGALLVAGGAVICKVSIIEP